MLGACHGFLAMYMPEGRQKVGYICGGNGKLAVMTPILTYTWEITAIYRAVG